MFNNKFFLLVRLLILTNSLQWTKIDIKLDFSNISETDKLYKTYLENTIFPEVIKIIQNFVFVNSKKKIEGFFETGCDRFIQIPEKYTIPTKSDLIIFIKIVDTFEKYLAFSAPCAVQEIDNRPIIGMISINKKKINFLKEFSDFFINTFVHEIFHILAFSPVLYDKFKNSEIFIEKIYTQVKNKKKKNLEFENEKRNSEKNNFLDIKNGSENVLYKIKSPRIVYAAKNHFNCSEIDSIFFENQGTNKSAGSHFEIKLFGNEIMTSQMNGNPIISFFTLGFLEDTNWYKIDYTNSQELSWGKNKGCDFFFGKNCDFRRFEEFCEFEGVSKCSGDRVSKSVCRKNVFGDNCILNETEIFKNCTKKEHFKKDFFFEKAGSFSRCFFLEEKGKKNSACVFTKCRDNKVFLVIEEKELFCDFGAKIEFKDFFIECPKNRNFCEKFEKTVDCNGRGFSNKNGECVCDFLFSGKNCEVVLPCTFNDHFCRFYLLAGHKNKGISFL